MILVTGATGHIGNVLVRQLIERGECVRALVLPGEDITHLQGLDLEIVAGDVLDPELAAARDARGFFGLSPGGHDLNHARAERYRPPG